MSYKYLYHFHIEGYNKLTDERETLAYIEQDRNTGMDNQLYRIIRHFCFEECATHRNIMATIKRFNRENPLWNTDPSLCSEYVGMMFFETNSLYTRKAIIVHDNCGKEKSWFVMNWREEGR